MFCKKKKIIFYYYKKLFKRLFIYYKIATITQFQVTLDEHLLSHAIILFSLIIFYKEAHVLKTKRKKI